MTSYNARPASAGPEHDRYRELCALATSGTLTEAEWSELRAHLSHCAACGEQLQQYREIARSGMALLMPEDASGALQAEASWSPEAAKRELFGRLARAGDAPAPIRYGESRAVPRPRWWQAAFAPQPLLLRAAAAVLLVAGLTAVAYRAGQQRAVLPPPSAVQQNSETAALRVQLADLERDRAALRDSLAARSADLERASRDLAARTSEVEKWKALSDQASGELNQKAGELASLKALYASGTTEREAISGKLAAAQTALETSQRQYDALRQAGSSAQLRAANLERRIEDLTARLAESEAVSSQARKFLAQDRDVRELMGARELHIADVFDVAENGKTQKPFGRVFYTKGKSLIFYAFDLDQQPKVANAAVFQAWGRHGIHDKQPLNMGIFYLDNETNKRWVLRFDDPAALARIDAIFVTVEARNGSPKPTGKQLLFASLRGMPNHP